MLNLYPFLTDLLYGSSTSTKPLAEIPTNTDYYNEPTGENHQAIIDHQDQVLRTTPRIVESRRAIVSKKNKEIGTLKEQLNSAKTIIKTLRSAATPAATPAKVDDLATRPAKFLQSKKPFISESALGIGLLAAIAGTGAYYLHKKSKQEEELAALKLREAQRRKLLRNLGIGTGAALGSYGLYRALR